MKAFTTGLLKSRITRRSLLAAVLPVSGLSLAWADAAEDQSGAEGQFRLGGAWIGTQESGHTLSILAIPLDPAGNTAALRCSMMTYGASVAALLAAFHANQASDWVGPAMMTSRNTAKATIVGYFQALGTVLEIKAIAVINCIFQFTDADTFLGNYTTSIYPPSADSLPHGDPVLGPVPGETITWRRVPLLWSFRAESRSES